MKTAYTVTPLVGVWIEILCKVYSEITDTVTPLVGVWIEIEKAAETVSSEPRHSPCGSVD